MMSFTLIAAAVICHALSLLMAAALGVNAKNEDLYGFVVAGFFALALCLLAVFLLISAGMRLGGAA